VQRQFHAGLLSSFRHILQKVWWAMSCGSSYQFLASCTIMCKFLSRCVNGWQCDCF